MTCSQIKIEIYTWSELLLENKISNVTFEIMTSGDQTIITSGAIILQMNG